MENPETESPWGGGGGGGGGGEFIQMVKGKRKAGQQIILPDPDWRESSSEVRQDHNKTVKTL